MNVLEKLRTGVSYPEVSKIINSATAVKTVDNYGEITTPDGEFYYLISSEDDIVASPDRFKAVHSHKHGVAFIVPKTSGGFDKNRFKKES